jgi:hypothetical protein
MISSIGGSNSMSQTYMAQMRQQMFNKIDTDGDGKHSKEEISAMIANGPQGGPGVDEIFDRADTNEDGYISQAEFDAVQGSNSAQENTSLQSSDPVDSLIKVFLETLEKEEQTASSASTDESKTGTSVAGMSQMLSDALKSYIQSGANVFSQGNFTQNLLGSGLYV